MNDVVTIDQTPPASANHWAGQIRAAWQKSVEAIFETGRLIAEAKAALPHGEFGAMIESDLPFSASTAQRLMAIASDEKLTNPAHVQHLPASWGTLYELTKLDADTFARRIAERTIRPDMQRREVATGGARSIMASREQPSESLDFFPTPPWASRALVEVVLPHLGVSLDGMIALDPACGEGHITGVLEEYGCEQVLGTDIKDYSVEGFSAPAWRGCADFLDPAATDVCPDWVITNPPFGEKTLDFALRALDVAQRGVALFVRQQWLEGVDRYEQLFSVAPPTLYAQFVERVNLCEGKWDPFGSTATAYCWLVWVKDREPQPPFWISPGQRKRLHRDTDIERFTLHPVRPLPVANSESRESTDGGEADALPPGVSEDEFAEYKALSAIACGIHVSGPLIDALVRDGFAWRDENSIGLTADGMARGQFLHEKVKAASNPDDPDAVRVVKPGNEAAPAGNASPAGKLPPKPGQNAPVEFTVGNMKPKYMARFSVALRPDGRFSVSDNTHFPSAGGGGPLKGAFATYAEALTYGLSELHRWLVGHRDSASSCTSDAERVAAKHGAQWVLDTAEAWGLDLTKALPGKYVWAVHAVRDIEGKVTMSDAERALRAGRMAGRTPKQLSEDLGVPLGSVKTWLHRLGLTDIAHMEALNAARKEAAQAKAGAPIDSQDEG